MKRLVVFVIALAALGLWSACSSDDDTPLGAEFIDDIIGSKPGDVFQDTIPVIADTVISFSSVLSRSETLELGTKDGYRRAIILRPNVSCAKDALTGARTLESAAIRLFVQSGSKVLARFYELGTRYFEGDSVPVLDTLDVIPDPGTGATTRLLQDVFPYEYALPAELVESWINDDSQHNGIAIVLVESDTTDAYMTFASSEAEEERPTLQASIKDGDRDIITSCRINHDATFVESLVPTQNLIVSDGFVRRIFFRVDLDQVSDVAAVHGAEINFPIVENSVFFGTDSDTLTVELYVPGSSDPTKQAFLSGQRVTLRTITEGQLLLALPVTNVLLFTLQGSVEDNGFVMKFTNENSEVRQVEFFSTAADSAKPFVEITYSDPAEFD